MRWYLGGVFLLMSMTAHADLFKDLEDALKKAIPSQTGTEPIEAALPNNDDPVTGPGGITATCAQLRSYNSANPDTYNIHLKDWTPETVAFLKDSVDRCAQQKISVLTSNNYDDKVNQIKGEANSQKMQLDFLYEQGKSTKRQDLHAEEMEVQYQEKQQKQQKLYECLDSNQYKLFNAQELVIHHFHNLEQYKKIQVRDRLVTKESGVRDLDTERKLGVYIVDEKIKLSEEFKQYKKYGGTSKTPESVTSLYQNPCKQLQL